ncbi:hypothetical protein AVI51_05575 [Piscirickettsia salmonis]|uniref:Uncharacterized protein n=1 Tax=Piscirickettsia salmonis TaxID=1238 RepID=A0A9Q5YJ50_PISSA|nr:hypothetical protein [Piscirickettsia salmonis]ALA25556.1 UDP-forming alpha,alpha-trehalose-phosphate synthase [Piscirickettsia salmonis]APS43063.1 hypothetical protein AVI48_00795 [Piscirickettsia salmonis]APS46411.1 hypothetical protein AVI49_01390 [Piscirickettsia salmonis]APS50379.1 hypothetical protein AVI50_05640 [Piscirickettsia salmonis]APS53581.1 hypothetical protein AVI51_05575 [Piscirickettsia salmonis]
MSVLGLAHSSYFPVVQTSATQVRGVVVTSVQKQRQDNHQQHENYANYQYWQVQPNLHSERAVAAYQQCVSNKEKEQEHGVSQIARVDLYA